MKILLRNSDQENWQLVSSVSYINEKELQKLLGDSPDLIPVRDMREEAGQLVAVVRELSVSIGAIDILGVTADGDIAVIECKLANNSEVKRKVIGQVLEYGSALWGMSYEEFDQKVQVRTGKPLAELVQNEIDDPDWDEELFRSNIEDNLLSGNFILMIVVDEINEAMTRIIRFLNACGNPQFSFAALEMRRFQSGDVEILLPKVDGDYRPTSQRVSASRRMWDKQTILKDAEEKLELEAFHILEGLLEFSESHSDGGVRYGSGIENGSFSFYFKKDNTKASIFSVFSNGYLQINFHYMSKIFTDQEIVEFKTTLAEISPFSDVIGSDKVLYSKKLGDEIDNSDDIELFKTWVHYVKNNI